MADEIKNESERELTKYHLKNSIKSTGNPEEDIKLGAKAYVYSRRIGLSGELLEEEIRQNPFDEIEMFMASNTDCIFNKFNITQNS
jgi:hypothetical protein